MVDSLFINNEWQQGAGDLFRSLCPVSQEVVWQGNMATLAQCKQAISSADSAFNSWSLLSLDERVIYIERYKKLLNRDKEKLALLISMEVGKPLWESRTEVAGMINKIDISINAYHKRTGTTVNNIGNGQTVLTHRAHGVFVILGPYNFPGHLPNGHIVPALLAGNTLVFKASELTPMVAEAMIKLFQEANFPKGVINLIQGNGEVGQTLLDLKPDGVLFTGSYQTGKKIHTHFAGQVEVILALEMGGNNPLVVSKVKDVSAAVLITIMSAFITAGQRCTCARRLFVPNTKWGNDFLVELVNRTKSLVVDDFRGSTEPFMGPVISVDVASSLMNKQQEWTDMGAESLLTMTRKEGALVTPGIIDITSVRHLMGDEELFGPLLQVIRYDDFSKAISMANDTQYGLASGLISDDKAQQDLFYKTARAGIVNINKQLTGALGSVPFGGIGLSGNHRASAFYAADFCAYPMATMSTDRAELLDTIPNGMNWLV